MAVEWDTEIRRPVSLRDLAVSAERKLQFFCRHCPKASLAVRVADEEARRAGRRSALFTVGNDARVSVAIYPARSEGLTDETVLWCTASAMRTAESVTLAVAVVVAAADVGGAVIRDDSKYLSDLGVIHPDEIRRRFVVDAPTVEAASKEFVVRTRIRFGGMLP